MLKVRNRFLTAYPPQNLSIPHQPTQDISLAASKASYGWRPTTVAERYRPKNVALSAKRLLAVWLMTINDGSIVALPPPSVTRRYLRKRPQKSRLQTLSDCPWLTVVSSRSCARNREGCAIKTTKVRPKSSHCHQRFTPIPPHPAPSTTTPSTMLLLFLHSSPKTPAPSKTSFGIESTQESIGRISELPTQSMNEDPAHPCLHSARRRRRLS